MSGDTAVVFSSTMICLLVCRLVRVASSAVIEIVGPAGVGKSTLSRALVCRSSNGDSAPLLLSAAQALCVPRLRKPAVLNRLLQRFLRTRASHDPSRLLFVERSRNAIIWSASSEEWRQFIAVCLKIASDNTAAPEERLVGLSFLLKTIATRQCIDTSDMDEALVLMDEPLSYRPGLFSALAPVPSRFIDQYYQAVPLPAAILYLSADVETVFRRLMDRQASGQVAHRHKRLSNAEIRADTEWSSRLAAHAVTVMKARGVPVLELCAEDALSTSVDRSSRFLSDLPCSRGKALD